MKRLFLVFGIVVVILPWLAGARANADLIHWSVSASATGDSNVTTTPFPGIPGSDAYIQLLSQPTTNGTNVANVALISLNANVGNPALESGPGINNDFGGPSSHYQLNLLLRDQASGDSGTLTFRGSFSGYLPLDSGWSTLTNTFVGPTTQTLKLGDNLYTATIGPVVLPQNLDPYFVGNTNANVGSISASISVQPLTNSTPEPSSLMLACLGLPLGLASLFRK